jgi:hypothetical protein
MGLGHVDQIVDDASQGLSNNRRFGKQLSYSSCKFGFLVTAGSAVKKTHL